MVLREAGRSEQRKGKRGRNERHLKGAEERMERDKGPFLKVKCPPSLAKYELAPSFRGIHINVTGQVQFQGEVCFRILPTRGF